MAFRSKRKKILSVKKKESEVRIILYGFRAETHKIVADFNRFFAANPALSCRVLVLNFSDARVADLDGDNNDVDYIVIKCNKAKTLKKIEIALSCDAELKKHLIDFQSVVFTSSF
ncbi:MAG TPA: hypothetical protein P5267_03755 [Patescibacteria group bacterium]|nr:hypothetical protein [Patescibacteria group bacterium]